MRKHVAVRKDNQSSAALWWEPFFNWQQEMNRNLREMATDFFPPEVLDAEEETLSAIQQSTRRIFGEMFNNRQMLTPWLTGNNTEPYVDIVENGKGYRINAEVPGIDPENLDVSVAEGALTVSGSKEECREHEEDRYIRHECRAGSFSRKIALPDDADMDNAEATFDKSVLLIEIPKKPDALQKARRLKISSRHKKSNEMKIHAAPEPEAKKVEKAKGKPSLSTTEKKAA